MNLVTGMGGILLWTIQLPQQSATHLSSPAQKCGCTPTFVSVDLP